MHLNKKGKVNENAKDNFWHEEILSPIVHKATKNNI